MHRKILLALAGTLSLLLSSAAQAVDRDAAVPRVAGGPQAVDYRGADAQVFLDWAAEALRPVSVAGDGDGAPGVGPLVEMIGDAPFASLAENTHSESEVFRLRNALFLALARERGYRVLAMESGVSEGAVLRDYVRGGPEPLDRAAMRGISWGFGAFPANHRLMQALRDHNASHPQAPLALYGYDVPGSPANTVNPTRGANVALEEALAYLEQVDGPAYEEMRDRVSGFTGLGPREAMAYYTALDPAARDRLTGTIADLIGLFNRRETAYTRASSAEAFAWGLQHAVGARQIDTMLRLRPPGLDSVDLVEHHTYRDRAMADNIEWIRDREGRDARMMIFGARFHIAGAPVLAVGWGQGDPVRESITLGSHLRARHGEQAVLIGHVLGRTAACKRSPRTGQMDFDTLLSTLGVRSFALDLRQAPPAVRAWLDQVHALDEVYSLNLARSFDVIYYGQVEPPDCRP